MKFLFPIALTFLLASHLFAEENWPRFRGPLGTGHSLDTNVPEKWDASSVVWKKKLGGSGQSSVINWGDKLFLTGANADGSERTIFCLNRKNGEVIWQKSVAVTGTETPHKMNSYATPSCVTDGEVVAAFFGPGGVHAWDMDGNALWSKKSAISAVLGARQPHRSSSETS